MAVGHAFGGGGKIAMQPSGDDVLCPDLVMSRHDEMREHELLRRKMAMAKWLRLTSVRAPRKRQRRCVVPSLKRANRNKTQMRDDLSYRVVRDTVIERPVEMTL
jgi:hypothetical protein